MLYQKLKQQKNLGCVVCSDSFIKHIICNTTYCIPSLSGQRITILLDTCCIHLATLLQYVATCTCWVLKTELVHMSRNNIVAQTWPNDYNIMQHPQLLQEKFDPFQIWANNTQCCNMLHRNVAIIWSGLEFTSYNPYMNVQPNWAQCISPQSTMRIRWHMGNRDNRTGSPCRTLDTL